MARHAEPNHVRLAKGKKIKIRPEDAVFYPPVNGIEPPEFLSDLALKEWHRMAQILHGVHLFNEATRDKLSRYAQAFADYQEVMIERNAVGAKRHTVTQKNFRQFAYWHRVVEMAERVMCDFEKEYGLTPAAMAKVRRPGTNGQTPGEKLAGFIGSKKQPTDSHQK